MMCQRRLIAVNVVLLCNVLCGVVISDALVVRLPNPRPNSRTSISTLAQPVIEPVLSSTTYANLQTPISTAWKHLVPNVLENPVGFDNTIQWDATEESSRQMAQRWFNQISQGLDHGTTIAVHEEMIENLTESAETFVEFCKRHMSGHHAPNKYKGRIVATRGSASTKCPQWHIDHVPVRWVQALYGPGCDWVEASDVHWDSINSLDDDDDNESVAVRNKKLVHEHARIHHAKQGDGVLLIGNRWQDFATVPKDISPAVHKSAEGLLPWQGRVLLTMDPTTVE